MDSVKLLRVSVDRSPTLSIVHTSTATIVDVISGIGGNLGLFTGFSVLSGVEFFYWMGQAFIRT